MKAIYWIVSAAVTLAGIGVMSAGAAQMRKENNTSEESITQTFTDVKNMNIALGSGTVTVQPDAKAEAVQVELRYQPKDVRLEQQGDVLILHENRKAMHFFDFGRTFHDDRFTAVITVPADLELGDVNFSIGSGSGSITGQKINSLSLEVGSGELEIAQSEIKGNTELSAASGDVSFVGDTFRLLHTETASGSLRLEQVQVAGDCGMSLSSGKISGNTIGIGGTTTLETSSGNVKLEGMTTGSDTTIELASGEIYLGLTGKQEDYSFNCTNLSGSTTIGEQSGKSLNITGGSKQITSEAASGSVKFGFTEN